MTTLYIDNQPADFDLSSSIAISLSTASVTSLEKGKTGYSRSIVIPATPLNRELMGDCEQLHSRNRFNAARHMARVECDGFTIIDGVMMLSECKLNDGGYYKFNIIGGNKTWASHASTHKLSSLFPDYSTTLSATTIHDSWTAPDQAVRFLPVQRERYSLHNSSVGMMPTTRILSTSDYHPFLHLKSIIHSTFAEAGYKVNSKFLSSPLFESLYISGMYPARDVAAMRNAMDFKAGRLSDVSAQADSLGIVYASPYTNYNTVGNIVETADDNNGRFYNHGGCFTTEGQGVIFRPLREVSASFEYNIKYVTDYRILSRNELAGFNTIILNYDDVRKFTIVNEFEDMRDKFECNKSYRIVIADYMKLTTYRLTADEVTNPNADLNNLQPADVTTRTIAEFSDRTKLISYSGDNPMVNLTLWEVVGNNVIQSPSDWMLYEGWVTETGQKEIEVKLQGKVERITPSAPKEFHSIRFGGASEGMTLTLKSDTTVRPVFNPHPTEGATLSFSQVACYDCSRLTLINAVKQMFNLCFYTDNLTRTVYIEPRQDFYTSHLVDWSARIDHSKPILCSELGDNLSRNMIWRYRTGDLAVAEYNSDHDDDFGSWSAQIENLFASDSDTINENLLFAPSISTDLCTSAAPSALLIQTTDSSLNDTDNLNFTPRIVRYMGMVALPQGEEWNYPVSGAEYPFAAFHNTAEQFCEPFTLCFEDRDGITGLHSYWDDNLTLYNNSRQVTLSLRLFPEEVESIVVPTGTTGCDFRAAFLLDIDGEKSIYRLEEICEYNPEADSTRCIFISMG